MHSSSYQKVSGFLMAIASAIFWGISGTCAQFLFQTKGVDPAWLVTWRMLLAGTLLVLYSIAKEKKAALGIWKTPKSAGKLVLFGILGMVSVQYTESTHQFLICLNYFHMQPELLLPLKSKFSRS